MKLIVKNILAFYEIVYYTGCIKKLNFTVLQPLLFKKYSVAKPARQFGHAMQI